MPGGRKALSLTGMRFGRWEVLSRAPDGPGPASCWLCRCDCGTERSVRGSALVTGRASSCGCLRDETNAARQRATRGVPHPTQRKLDSELGYLGAHARIRRLRGRASDHECIDCGQTAAEWALRHEAHKMRGPIGKYERDYSPDPNDYDPRCRKCHKAYDRAYKGVVMSEQPADQPDFDPTNGRDEVDWVAFVPTQRAPGEGS